MGIHEFRFPELGEGLHEGRIDHWVVKVGDVVKEDDVLAEVENDKAMVELPSPVDGKVLDIKVADGTTVTVGDLIILLEVEGAGNVTTVVAQATPEPLQQDVKTTAVDQAGLGQVQDQVLRDQSQQPENVATMPSVPASEVLATPAVRKFAREHGVNLTFVTGTGTHQKITLQDVEAFLATGGTPVVEVAVPSQGQTDVKIPGTGANIDAVPAIPVGATALEEERVPLTSIRRLIASAMVKSKYTAPHVTVMDEANVEELVALRGEIKPLAAQRDIKITYLPFIVKALVAACKKYPQLNATFDEERQEVVLKHYYHVGIATDTERGLVVPVVSDADRKNMWEVAQRINDMAARARTNKLTPAEMKGSTISISNIGSAGGMFFTPIINYPEVAILGVGRITEKPVIKNGEIVPGSMMALSLSFDHRIIDGALAQNFVNEIKSMLENPRLLLMGV